MSLFDLKELYAKNHISHDKKIEGRGEAKVRDELNSAGAYVFEKKGVQLFGKSYKTLKDEIGLLKNNAIIEYYTEGAWSFHHLIEHIALQVGSCDFWLTSYSISEEPVRKLLNLYEHGFLKNLTCLLDRRAKDRKGKAFQLLSNFATVKMVELHAKVALFQNENWNISILTSQNLTKNRRIEVGTIHVNENSVKFHKNWIENKIASL